MVRGLEPAHAVIACIVLAGCDGVFGLQHIHEGPDGPIQPQDAPDRVCPPAGGSNVTKLFGGREGAVPATGVADTFLSSDLTHTSSNFGALDRLFVCFQCQCSTDCESVAGGDDDVVSLLRFDLGSQIPTCSMVQTARLYLHTTGDNLGGGSSVAVFTMLEAWDEGTGALPVGVTGAASWKDRRPGTPWTAPGAGTGSRAATPLALFAPTGTEADYTVQIDPEVVQAWVDDAAKNHGFAFMVQGSTSDVHFYSSEATLATSRPALEVTYRLP